MGVYAVAVRGVVSEETTHRAECAPSGARVARRIFNGRLWLATWVDTPGKCVRAGSERGRRKETTNEPTMSPSPTFPDESSGLLYCALLYGESPREVSSEIKQAA